MTGQKNSITTPTGQAGTYDSIPSVVCLQRTFLLTVSCTMKVYTSIVASSIAFNLCMWSLPVSVDGSPTQWRKCEVESGTLE